MTAERTDAKPISTRQQRGRSLWMADERENARSDAARGGSGDWRGAALGHRRGAERTRA